MAADDDDVGAKTMRAGRRQPRRRGATMMLAGGYHGVGCDAPAWLAGRGLYELGGLRMLVIGPLHLEADADEDAEACVNRDDEYFGGLLGWKCVEHHAYT